MLLHKRKLWGQNKKVNLGTLELTNRIQVYDRPLLILDQQSIYDISTPLRRSLTTRVFIFIPLTDLFWGKNIFFEFYDKKGGKDCMLMQANIMPQLNLSDSIDFRESSGSASSQILLETQQIYVPRSKILPKTPKLNDFDQFCSLKGLHNETIF